MMRNRRGVNRFLKSEEMVVRDRNQRQDAQTTPQRNRPDSSGGKATRKDPSSSDTSMIACGLNHVTTQAMPMVFMSGMFTLIAGPATSRDSMSRSPMYITTRLPASKTPFRISSECSISAPMPKKPASARVTSKKMTMSAVR